MDSLKTVKLIKSVNQSARKSVSLSVFLSFCRSSACLCLWLSFSRSSACLSLCLLIILLFVTPVSLVMCTLGLIDLSVLSTPLTASVCLSAVQLSVNPDLLSSILIVCLFLCLCVYLSFCLSVCLSHRQIKIHLTDQSRVIQLISRGSCC